MIVNLLSNSNRLNRKTLVINLNSEYYIVFIDFLPDISDLIYQNVFSLFYKGKHNFLIVSVVSSKNVILNRPIQEREGLKNEVRSARGWRWGSEVQSEPQAGEEKEELEMQVDQKLVGR